MYPWNGLEVTGQQLDADLETLSQQVPRSGATNRLDISVVKARDSEASACALLSNVHDIYGLDQQTTRLVIDTGASDTVGSPEAVEGLAEAIKLVYPESKVVVNQQEGKRVKFRMADGRVKPALSRVYIGTPLGQLAIYVIEAVGVPILLSIAALRSLKAAICFTTNTMMYRTPDKDGNEIESDEDEVEVLGRRERGNNSRWSLAGGLKAPPCIIRYGRYDCFPLLLELSTRPTEFLLPLL
jgi:hypothetical protein